LLPQKHQSSRLIVNSTTTHSEVALLSRNKCSPVVFVARRTIFDFRFLLLLIKTA
jgi:hypothetical protein